MQIKNDLFILDRDLRVSYVSLMMQVILHQQNDEIFMHLLRSELSFNNLNV